MVHSTTLVSPSPEFPIRLIALDIDGTLVDDSLRIPDRTRSAIHDAMERGVEVVLATGRMVSSAMRFARDLRLRGPVIGYQGGLIRAMPTDDRRLVGRLLKHYPMPAEVAREIVTWTRAIGLDPHLNHLEQFILRADDPHADDYSVFMGANAVLVPDLIGSIRRPITKVLAIGEPPLPTEFAPAARDHFAGRAGVTVSHPKYLEFVAPGVSKGSAIRWLARRIGVPLSQTLAIGDQWNDFEMLAEVGHGAAMPSAPQGVQAVARYIAPPLSEDGAARMIERLVLAAPSDALAASRRMAADALERRAKSA
jgi:Cof subfamily protein (haloacid dehalogenase superfamily)